MKLKRNDKCPCGSGKKYKKCCYPDPDRNAEIIRTAAIAGTWEEMAQLLSKPMAVYRLKVRLIRMGDQEIEEEVSRTVEVEGKHTLFELHLDIQYAFDWDNDHMFSFFLGGKLYDRENEYSGDPLGGHITAGLNVPTKPAAKTQLRDLRLTENSTFLYLFDYGDKLIHEIMVLQIRDKNDGDKEFPAIVGEAGTPPPQYGEME